MMSFQTGILFGGIFYIYLEGRRLSEERRYYEEQIRNFEAQTQKHQAQWEADSLHLQTIVLRSVQTLQRQWNLPQSPDYPSALAWTRKFDLKSLEALESFLDPKRPRPS